MSEICFIIQQLGIILYWRVCVEIAVGAANWPHRFHVRRSPVCVCSDNRGLALRPNGPNWPEPCTDPLVQESAGQLHCWLVCLWFLFLFNWGQWSVGVCPHLKYVQNLNSQVILKVGLKLTENGLGDATVDLILNSIVIYLFIKQHILYHTVHGCLRNQSSVPRKHNSIHPRAVLKLTSTLKFTPLQCVRDKNFKENRQHINKPLHFQRAARGLGLGGTGTNSSTWNNILANCYSSRSSSKVNLLHDHV